MLKAYGRAYENRWRGERLNHLISNVVMETRGIYLVSDPEDQASFANGVKSNLKDIEALLTQWRSLGPTERSQEQALDAEASSFIALRRHLADLALTGHIAEAEQLGLSDRSQRKAFQADVDLTVNQARIELDATKARADQFSQHRVQAFVITALMGIGIMMALSLWLLSRFITRPLNQVATALINTSKGDYTTPLVEQSGQDEVSAVWRAIAALKASAIEASRLAELQREVERQHEMELRQIMLD